MNDDWHFRINVTGKTKTLAYTAWFVFMPAVGLVLAIKALLS